MDSHKSLDGSRSNTIPSSSFANGLKAINDLSSMDIDKTPLTSHENGFKRMNDYDFLPSLTIYTSKRKKVNNVSPLQEAAIQALAQMDKDPKTDKIGTMAIIFNSNLRTLPSDNDINACFSGWQEFYFNYKKKLIQR